MRTSEPVRQASPPPPSRNSLQGYPSSPRGRASDEPLVKLTRNAGPEPFDPLDDFASRVPDFGARLRAKPPRSAVPPPPAHERAPPPVDLLGPRRDTAGTIDPDVGPLLGTDFTVLAREPAQEPRSPRSDRPRTNSQGVSAGSTGLAFTSEYQPMSQVGTGWAAALAERFDLRPERSQSPALDGRLERSSSVESLGATVAKALNPVRGRDAREATPPRATPAQPVQLTQTPPAQPKAPLPSPSQLARPASGAAESSVGAASQIEAESVPDGSVRTSSRLLPRQEAREDGPGDNGQFHWGDQERAPAQRPADRGVPERPPQSLEPAGLGEDLTFDEVAAREEAEAWRDQNGRLERAPIRERDREYARPRAGSRPTPRPTQRGADTRRADKRRDGASMRQRDRNYAKPWEVARGRDGRDDRRDGRRDDRRDGRYRRRGEVDLE